MRISTLLPLVVAGVLGVRAASHPPLATDGPAGPDPAITAADLRARLSAFAHDSMLGREAGTLGNFKATEYLAAQAAALGLEPAGSDGGYFQTVPLTEHGVASESGITVGTETFVLGTDFVTLPGDGAPIQTFGTLDRTPVVFGGAFRDPEGGLSPDDVAGKLVVLTPPADGRLSPEGVERYAGAAGLALVVLDLLPPELIQFFVQPRLALGPAEAAPADEFPLAMAISNRMAEALLGQPLADVRVGATGASASGSLHLTSGPPAYPTRNVVAILRGSDPVLRDEFVVIGAHNDHNGLTAQPVDHDSLWVIRRVLSGRGSRDLTDQQRERIRTMLDSLRALRPPRIDSVFNGADDDGSGSVTALEIAEAFALRAERPRRSLLFVWHTAEELGLYGAQHFSEHPTVDRDRIVAALNLDMVGRGTAADLENGGPGYLQLIGSRRLSTELGDLVEMANVEGGYGFTFDYTYDADGHPENYYCRSDHYHYARWGIPVVFFTTGDHPDYHQLTDEPQYIAYDKMARVGRLVMDVADRVANLDRRVVVDKPKPDPYGACRQ